MAAAIREAHAIEAKLIPGSGGIFDVVVDGKRIYCKGETGRFPTDEEILEQLTDR